jgi:hypothetical protein
MRTTAKQDRQFVDAIIDTTILESAIDWIANNLRPEDVFDEKDLETWAEESDYIKR